MHFRGQLFCLSAALLMAGTSARSSAAPVFTDSTISVMPPEPLEGGQARFIVTLKNTGDAPAQSAELKIEGPAMGYLTETTGADAVDYDERTVTGSLSLGAGEEKIVEVEVLAPRNSGGKTLSLTVHLAHYPSKAELWAHQTVTIGTRLSTSGMAVGGVRITPAGIAVLAWLLVLAVAWTWARRTASRSSSASKPSVAPSAGVVAVMVAIGFWMIFASMAWRDYRVLTAWPETTATILGRRMTASAASTSNQSKAVQGGPRDVYTPEFALRYTANGRAVVSTGYDTGSSLHIGGRVRHEEEMRDWKHGVQIPCWYNPEDPLDVVVRRGFGGAYLFALFPVPVFWFGIVLLRGGCGRR